MNKIILLFTLGIFLSFSSSEASEKPRAFQGKSFITYGKSLKDIPLNTEQQRSFTIDAAIATSIFQSSASSFSISDFPVGLTETKTVELKPARPVADDQTQWWAGSKENRRLMKAPNVISYEGFIDGEKNSSIFLTYFKGDVTGMVVRGNGQRYVVAPDVKNYDTKHEHVLTSEEYVAELTGWKGLVCGNDDLAVVEKSIKESDKVLSNDLLEARVAVDITNSFYRKFNDYEKTQAYVMSLFGIISRTYEEEINVVLYLNSVQIYDILNDDPYKGLVSGHELLPKMANYWVNNVNIDRDVTHLLSELPSFNGIIVAGVAYLGTICQPGTTGNPYGSYGVSLVNNFNVSLPALNYIESVSTIAHEIGHTFGSPHTHTGGGQGGYEPPIDSCVTSKVGDPVYFGDAANRGPTLPPNNGIGTIMSYCNLKYQNTMQMTFGPRPAARIRAGAEKCLKIPAKPTIYMQYPVGKQNLMGGAQEEIHWTSARVASVNIQYSIDGGANWIMVNPTPILATTRKLMWTVPTVSTTKLLVRVSDASNATVFDQTEATLSVQAAALSLTKPTGGERIGQKENVSITWNKQLVTKVNIEYSLDGQTWLPVASGVTASSYIWTVPAVVSSTAFIRITDADNGALVSQSSAFAIGVATATLKTPNGGELWGRTAKVWITWNSDFVSKIQLEYSTDNGDVWKPIRKPVNPVLDGASGAYQWTVPDDLGDNSVIVRIKNATTTEKEELDRSDAPFTINTVNGIEDEGNQTGGLSIIGISPNPAGEEAYVSYTAGELVQSLKIELINVTGQIVARFDQPNQFSAGEQSVKIDLRELPQGVYLLVLKNGMSQVSSSLRIVR
ncbi:MAG: M12 family metallo-peptidase [Bacteroidota bacterium]